MTKNRALRLLALAILCVLPTCPAIVTYTDLASWQAVATQSGASVTFANLASTPGSHSTGEASIFYTDPGVTFTAPGDIVQVHYAGSGEPYYNWGTGAIIHPVNQTTGVIRVDLTAAVTAFATNMMIYNGAAGSNMTVTVKSGTTALSPSPWTLATSAQPAPAFFGVVSTDSSVTFNSIFFTPPQGNWLYAQLDNVRLGAYNSAPEPDPVPEPGTGFLAIGGIGLIALGCLRKRC